MNRDTILALAQNALDVGNLKAACEFYEVGLTKYPNDVDILESYSEVMIHFLREPERARQMLRHAIEVSPNQGYVKYSNLAQLSEGDEALRLYNKAYELVSFDLSKQRSKKKRNNLLITMTTLCCAIAELYLTDLCFVENAENKCEQAINRALEHNSSSIEAHQLRGSLRLSQDRVEEAKTALFHAVDLTHELEEEYQPEYEAKVELARLLIQVDLNKTLEFVIELLQLDDTSPYAWFLLGEAARLSKLFLDSARFFRRARILICNIDSNSEAIKELDESIALLVTDMGGPEAFANIPDLDHPNPLDLLELDIKLLK